MAKQALADANQILKQVLFYNLHKFQLYLIYIIHINFSSFHLIYLNHITHFQQLTGTEHDSDKVESDQEASTGSPLLRKR